MDNERERPTERGRQKKEKKKGQEKEKVYKYDATVVSCISTTTFCFTLAKRSCFFFRFLHLALSSPMTSLKERIGEI